MIAHNQFLSVGTVSAKTGIRTAARHNLREIQAEQGADSHIDATRMHLNIVLAGAATASDVAAVAKRLMLEEGISKTRKNCAVAIEILVSLPPASTVAQSAFFADALVWARSFYGLPVLSAVVHNDEPAPHMHVLMLPLVEGRMQGNAALGGKARMYAAQGTFFEQVGQLHGLTRPKPPERMSSTTRAKSASMILTALQSDPTLMDNPCIESAMLALFGRDPVAMLSAMGLSIPHPPKSTKTFVQIMTKPCPEKKTPIVFRSFKTPIAVSTPKTSNHYLCVSGSPETVSAPTAKRIETAVPAVQLRDHDDDYQRIRDDAQEAGEWDSGTGEFRHAVERDRATVLHRRFA